MATSAQHDQRDGAGVIAWPCEYRQRVKGIIVMACIVMAWLLRVSAESEGQRSPIGVWLGGPGAGMGWGIDHFLCLWIQQHLQDVLELCLHARVAFMQQSIDQTRQQRVVGITAKPHNPM